MNSSFSTVLQNHPNGIITVYKERFHAPDFIFHIYMELGTVNSRTKGDHASFICCNRPFMASLLFCLSLESAIGTDATYLHVASENTLYFVCTL